MVTMTFLVTVLVTVLHVQSDGTVNVVSGNATEVHCNGKGSPRKIIKESQRKENDWQK